jgi:hypothetical protein
MLNKLKKIGIAGCVLAMALAVAPAGAFARDRAGDRGRDWHDRARPRQEYRENNWRDRQLREYGRRDWIVSHTQRGYYDRFGHWCWY